MIEATGAQIVVKLLERQGIETVAGIPGGMVLPIYDELSKSSIDHVLVRHEQGAGFFAQGMARTTGKPAVCIATSGPGVMNLLTAVADARADSIPLVAITGQVAMSLIGTDAFQECDTFGLSFPITKHSVMVTSAAELLKAIPDAFVLAASGRPGPVLVDIPKSVQQEKIRFEAWPEPGVPDRHASRFHSRGVDMAERLASAADALTASVKPLMYLGGGCNSPDASKGIAGLLETLPMPVVSSLMGLGSVPSTHPDFAGMVGMHGSAAANRAMHEAELVLAVGVRFDDRATGLVAEFCPNARIIHVDIDAAEVNKILPSWISVIADAESALPLLAQLIREKAEGSGSGAPALRAAAAAARGEWLSAVRGFRADYERWQAGMAREASARSPYPNPGEFIAALPALAAERGIDPERVIVATDVGQHQMWAAQFYPISRPRSFLTSGSLGTMGFGLPVANGAAAANPGSRVICISGDGSIMMNVQELATLAERGWDVTVIVFDNHALGMVRQQQAYLLKGNFASSVYDRSPDLLAIAAGFGIPAIDASDPDWADRAFSGTGPRFVVCRIAQDEMVLPFVPGGKSNVEPISALLEKSSEPTAGARSGTPEALTVGGARR